MSALVSTSMAAVGNRHATACRSQSLTASTYRLSRKRDIQPGFGCVNTDRVPKDLEQPGRRPFVWLSVDVGGRMTVLKLSDGSLWVHSPLSLDEPLKEQLATLGPVKHIVSPNYEHVKFAKQWIEAYPEARSYACPGLQEKHPEIAFSESLRDDNTAPASWLGEVECLFLDFEHNPFNRKPFFNEVLFLHVPSRSLVVTDFYWNLERGMPWKSAAFKFAMDRVYAPFFWKFMIHSPDRYQSAWQQLESWDWDRILVCHGTIVESGGKAALASFARPGRRLLKDSAINTPP